MTSITIVPLLSSLPDDIILSLLLLLPPSSIIRFAMSCRMIYQLFDSNEFWCQLVKRCDNININNNYNSDNYKLQYINHTIPYKSASTSFLGSWINSHYLVNRNDEQTLSGQCLTTNVWWLDIYMEFILANGDWCLLLRSKREPNSILEQITWKVNTSNNNNNNEWGSMITTNIISENQYNWIIFRPNQVAITINNNNNNNNDIITYQYIRLNNKKGYSKIKVTIQDRDTNRYKYGWSIDQIRWIRIEKINEYIQEII